MHSPPTVSGKVLQRFNSEIARKIQSAMDLDVSRHLICDKYTQLVGQKSLVYGVRDTTDDIIVSNNRRLENYAFVALKRRRTAILLSINFEWHPLRSLIRFGSAQFVVYVAGVKLQPDIDPLQLMRLEWEGRSEKGTFEAPAAGHPHWQIDATFNKLAPKLPLSSSISLDKIEVAPSPSWLSRLHLASAAEGWTKGSGWSGDEYDYNVHANSPENIEALSAWTVSAARYLRQQLDSAVD